MLHQKGLKFQDSGRSRMCNRSDSTTMKTETQKFPDVITLNVGGHYFMTKRSTLTKDGESMLAAMFSGRHNLDTDSEGRYFIDRDGTYFKYILNFMRDEMELPPPSLAVQVYKDAQFYQIQKLSDRLERFANVFALKLDNAKKSKLGDSFARWKNAIITTAQIKSMEKLSTSGKVSLLCNEERKKLLESSECIGQLEHSFLVVKDGCENKYLNKSYEYVKHRLCHPDIPLDITSDDMGLFARLTERELRSEGYTCSVWKERIKCENSRVLFGIGKEQCDFHIEEYFVEFEWPTPETTNSEFL